MPWPIRPDNVDTGGGGRNALITNHANVVEAATLTTPWTSAKYLRCCIEDSFTLPFRIIVAHARGNVPAFPHTVSLKSDLALDFHIQLYILAQ